MTNDEFKSIIVLAFKAVETPDFDSFYRKVCRSFSSQYATPLKEVENYPEEYVLQHYFEGIYQELLEGKSEDSQKAWLETKARILQAFFPEEDLDEEEYWQKALEEEFKKDHQDDKNELERFLAGGNTSASVTPNLIPEHQDIHLQGEDEIPND